MNIFSEPLYTVGEVSVATNAPRHKLYSLIRNGNIEVVRMGPRETRIPHRELERLYGLSNVEVEERLQDALIWPSRYLEDTFDFNALGQYGY